MTNNNTSPVAGVTDEELNAMIDHVGAGDGIDGPEAYAALKELRDRRALAQPSGKVSDEWVRDAAMNVMLATEVDEATCIPRAALAAQLPARPVVKALEWSDSMVFGVRKWRGFGTFGEFAAFSGNDLTDEQIVERKEKYQTEYTRAVLSALEGEGR